MIRGISYIVLACFIWGSIFIIPRFMEGFDSFEVSLGRYFFYGTASLLVLASNRFKLFSKIDSTLWWKAFWLGLGGNILYYFVLVLCMRDAGAAISALMLGVSPITIAWYGNWRAKESRFRNLVIPSIVTAIGLILVNVPALERSAMEETLAQYAVGLLAGFIALGLWTWYAVSSKVVLTRYPSVSASEWSTLLGFATLVSLVAVVGIYLYFIWDSPHLSLYMRWSDELQAFLIGSACLGIPCSWVGFYLWSKGSYLLPVSLSGQLMICETLFGLCFVHLLDQHMPTTVEWLGMLAMLGGILAALLLTKQEKAELEQSKLQPSGHVPA